MVDGFRENLLHRSARRAVTLTRAVHAGRTRRKAVPPRTTSINGARLCDLLADTGAKAQLLRIPIRQPRWTTTGLQVSAGDTVTWLAWGYAYVIRPLAVGVYPRFALAGRVGGGVVHQSGRDTYTFTAERDGQVQLGSLFPGELRPDGRIGTDRIPYWIMTGGFDAVVACWSPGSDARAGLAAVADRDTSGLCAAEAKRLDDAPTPPAGWRYHPLLRPAETYAPTGRGIAAHVQDGVGIIQRPVDTPLTPTLRLRWSWRMDELPSKLAEDTTLTHDYLSIAAEFDDGRDLTWHWSATLPAGFAYPCPFDHWRRRETHIVTRSGRRDLGRWVEEERPVRADHHAAVGGPPPSRVVAVWLISCSFLQGNEGRGEFASISLVDGETVINVL